MKLFIQFLFILSIAFVSCKQSDSASVNNNEISGSMPVEEQYIIHNQFAKNDSLYQQQRSAARSIMEQRIKNTDPNMTNVLIKDYWHIDAFLRGNEMKFGADAVGFWLDFNEGNKYSYGSYDKTYGTGRYVYTTENNLILLLDDDQRFKPQEFEVKYNNDALVLVGQATYQDNSMQVKLFRRATYPEKPAEKEWDGNGGDETK